ncbi:exopolygalacturonase-like [Aristolochia californica]|uniref:exopolygalacturonase-like n=1 Tax=Aristolochia californica TaxID=171875 RepID=UPI0035D9F728
MSLTRNLKAIFPLGLIIFLVNGVALTNAVGDGAPAQPSPASPSSGSGVFDVTKYGAKADGQTDDAKAFMQAWNEACSFNGNAALLIPEGTYLLGAITFEGPCFNKGSPAVELKGTLKAPPGVDSFPTSAWITFRSLHGLVISGGGTIDGQGGAEAWTVTSCPEKTKCKIMASSMKLISCTTGQIRGIKFVDSKGFNLRMNKCSFFYLDNLNITAPEDSPNTDGIHVSDSSTVNITNSVIGVGDDCVSLGDGNNDIFVSNITCGPGHGISIGSLGKYKNESPVQGIHVKNCTLKGTTNGVRIKSWGGSPSLTARNITFEDIIMDDVSFPIIIDQKYCPAHHCTDKPSAVQLSDVTYKNIRGSSFTRLAVNLICSSQVPCKNMQFIDINLNYQGTDQPTASMCQHVEATTTGTMNPPPCLQL